MTNAEKEILADRLIKKLESLGYTVTFNKQTNVKHGIHKTRWSIVIAKQPKTLYDIPLLYTRAEHWTPKRGLVKRNMLDKMLSIISNHQQSSLQYFLTHEYKSFITFLADYFSSYEELEMRLTIDGF